MLAKSAKMNPRTATSEKQLNKASIQITCVATNKQLPDNLLKKDDM